MSLWQAVYLLQNRMDKPRFAQTNPGLWNRLIDIVDSMKTREKEFELLGVRLGLFHPTTPDAEPFMRMSSEQDKASRPVCFGTQHQIGHTKDMIQAIRMFNWQGRPSEAETVVSIARVQLREDLRGEVEQVFDNKAPIRKVLKQSFNTPPAWVKQSWTPGHIQRELGLVSLPAVQSSLVLNSSWRNTTG